MGLGDSLKKFIPMKKKDSKKKGDKSKKTVNKKTTKTTKKGATGSATRKRAVPAHHLTQAEKRYIDEYNKKREQYKEDGLSEQEYITKRKANDAELEQRAKEIVAKKRAAQAAKK